MPRAARICPKPGCPEDMPCPIHKRKPWQEKNPRSKHTKSGWQQQREAKRVLRRDNHVCHVCGLPGADQVDHLIPIAEGGIDSISNKAAIHKEPCHKDKTQAEAARGRGRTSSRL